jgi:hypothetical protein
VFESSVNYVMLQYDLLLLVLVCLVFLSIIGYNFKIDLSLI